MTRQPSPWVRPGLLTLLLGVTVVSLSWAAGGVAMADVTTSIEMNDSEQVQVPENGTRTVDLTFEITDPNENGSDSPVEFTVTPGENVEFTDVGRVSVGGVGTVESAATVDDGVIRGTLVDGTNGDGPGTVTVENATISAGDVPSVDVTADLAVSVRDTDGSGITLKNEAAFAVSETWNADETPVVIDTGVNDSDGDGTVRPGENVTVTASTGRPVELDSAAVSVYNYTHGEEGIDGDETPARGTAPMDGSMVFVTVFFDEPQDIDAVEYTFAEQLPERINVFTSRDGAQISPDSRTVRVNRSLQRKTSFTLTETGTGPSTPLSISDVNAYDDGERLDESNWTVTVVTVTKTDLTSTFDGRNESWTSPVTLDSDGHLLTMQLRDRRRITGLRLDSGGGASAGMVQIIPARPGTSDNGPWTRAPPSPNEIVTFPPTNASILSVIEQDVSVAEPWTLENATVFTVDDSRTTAVTVDASALGAGSVEATRTDDGTYAAQIRPDYRNVSEGEHRVNVIVTDDGGGSSTARTETIDLDKSAPTFEDTPSVSDSDGDGTLSSGENVTVTTEPVRHEPITPTVVYGHSGNRSDGSEGIDGDETPWRSYRQVDENVVSFHTHFDRERTVDTVEITFDGSAPESIRVTAGDNRTTLSPANTTVRVPVGNQTVGHFWFVETDRNSSEPLSVSDVSAYDENGRQIPESRWRPVFVTWTDTRITDELNASGTSWTAPVSIRSNYLQLNATLADTRTITGVRLDHNGTNYPRTVSVMAERDGQTLGMWERNVSSSDTHLSIPTVDADRIYVTNRDDETEQPWEVRSLSLVDTNAATRATVSVDASTLGAGTLSATPNEDGEYVVRFRPDYENISDGEKRVNVTVTDEIGQTGTATSDPVDVDTRTPPLDGTPTAADGDGDGAVLPGETVHVRGDFVEQELTPSRIEAGGSRNSPTFSGFEGDDTAWQTGLALNESSTAMYVRFEEDRSIDTVEMTFDGEPPDELSLSYGDTYERFEPSSRTVTVSTDGATASGMMSVEYDHETSEPYSISDVDFYIDGQRVNESSMTIFFVTNHVTDVTRRLTASESNWTSRMPMDSNGVDVRVVFEERHTFSEIRLEQDESRHPRSVTIGSYRNRSNDSPYPERVGQHGGWTGSPTENVSLENVSADMIKVQEVDPETPRPWTIERITVLGSGTTDVASVTVDATSLGAGVVEADVANGSFTAEIQPDLDGIEGGRYTLPVTVTDVEGNSRTVQSTEVVVKSSDPDDESESE